ncbi:uncharacterized protein with transglutaminase domain [Sinobacterium caligoides]|uniref:Uncharacterized protein with transglutaminase domain n=1 Tax=Sinobacterium caligoides TaxID=933926 RepID=A0A3N2D526_9GAMM|nr:inactive transglutaminase family protein [Sinobacterium caligoides]ROR94869.1 uncharacterized protein with transglutaminase domain [Sinobacterium caligoides]
MSDKVKIYLIATVLCVLGLGATAYKHISLHFPLTPGEQIPVWSIEAKVQFKAVGDPVKVRLTLPKKDGRLIMLDDSHSSEGYGFSFDEQADNNVAEWTKREAQGPQTLYYRIRAVDNYDAVDALDRSPAKIGELPEFDEAKTQTANSLIARTKKISADNRSFATQLVHTFNKTDPDPGVNMLMGNRDSRTDKAHTMLGLLAMADVPARLALGLKLEDGRRKQKLISFIEVYQDEHWVTINPLNAEKGVPEGVVLWRRGGESLLEVVGGKSSSVDFSIVRSPLSAKQVALARTGDGGEQAALIDFSIYSLPSASQNAFKTILLVPIGALVIVFLRVIIGVRTSGTFMPILIALAFMQTKLLPGLLMFIAIVAAGLIIRAYLSKLNLLLVARISAVVIVVIGIMAGFSIISDKLGFDQVMTITFFPMIILAWTIERMSILWEEEGAKEVLVQGGGSLMLATIAYLAMSSELVKHLTFNFPELLLVLLAVIILLGQYTGYRLTELRRFQSIVDQKQ